MTDIMVRRNVDPKDRDYSDCAEVPMQIELKNEYGVVCEIDGTAVSIPGSHELMCVTVFVNAGMENGVIKEHQIEVDVRDENPVSAMAAAALTAAAKSDHFQLALHDAADAKWPERIAEREAERRAMQDRLQRDTL